MAIERGAGSVIANPAILEGLLPEGGDMKNRFVELLEARGEARREARGIEKGREEGRALEAHRLLRLVLENRFGPLPGEVATAIDKHRIDRLEDLIVRASVCTGLDDFVTVLESGD